MSPSTDREIDLEKELLSSIASGNRGAFRQLYERFSPNLYALALQLSGDAGAAEEVLQDTFVKVWFHANDYDPQKSRPFTWCITLLKRTAIDHFRKNKKHSSGKTLSTEEHEAAQLAASENVLVEAQAHEDQERLEGALSKLDASHRRALELALLSTLSHPEIADRLEIPLGTAKTWIRRGLEDLRRLLKQPSP